MYNTPPATRNLELAINKGGNVSFAKRTARYVEPHITYTAKKADINLIVDGLARVLVVMVAKISMLNQNSIAH
jgi:hypothetical protein